jgi:hypothetical protein
MERVIFDDYMVLTLWEHYLNWTIDSYGHAIQPLLAFTTSTHTSTVIDVTLVVEMH